MDPLRKATFIVNPNSGTSRNKPRAAFFAQHLNSKRWQCNTVVSKGPAHATELAAAAVASGADVVVAVGGDGTVNEVACALQNTNTALGIIPMGSGNGLARHHHIPLDPASAVQVIDRCRVIPHDVVLINGRIAVNVSGIGFDAHVAALFGRNGKRGFASYLKLVFREFPRYPATKFMIAYNNTMLEKEALMITLANASQFGNGAVIASAADTNDGRVNAIIVKRMPGWKMPWFALSVFRRAASRSRWVTEIETAHLQIECPLPVDLHIDGEPAGAHKRFDVTVVPAALKLIIP